MSPPRLEIYTRIADVSATGWNNLVSDNHPFCRHEFLCALESSGAVSEKYGWTPCHLGIWEKDKLVAAMPLYEKSNSYGEFVFDNAMADAYARHRLNYFPKLVSAIPYTPIIGPRLLYRENEASQRGQELIHSAREFCRQGAYSGLHLLFAREEELQSIESLSEMTRFDCQYHWFNQNYHDFDHFLAQLNARKRKRIRQERRKVNESGVEIRVLDGYSATTEDWQQFSRFYRDTFKRKWGVATLNDDFFIQVAKVLPDALVLVMADYQGQPTAGALMYRSDSVLYGRHWGCNRRIDGLHFECCYYQGIEYAIKHGLQRFEPGAQGEHKIARGFQPILTRSMHWLQETPLTPAIHRYVKDEQQAIESYIVEAKKQSPYRICRE